MPLPNALQNLTDEELDAAKEWLRDFRKYKKNNEKNLEAKKIYEAKPSLPKNELKKIKHLTFVRIKWLDAPDTIALITHIDMSEYKHASILYLTKNAKRIDYETIELDQIIEVLHKVEWPKLG